jgi:hypothetical protein
MNAQVVWDFLLKLIGPFWDSIKGQLNWKELFASILLMFIFVFSGGKLDDLIQFLLNIINANPAFHSSILSGIVALIVALAHRVQQGRYPMGTFDKSPKV